MWCIAERYNTELFPNNSVVTTLQNNSSISVDDTFNKSGFREVERDKTYSTTQIHGNFGEFTFPLLKHVWP